MRKLRITICLATLLAIALSTQAEDFTLTDTQHLDVTKTYIDGYLYDYSTANLLTGGNILANLYVNDQAKLDIFDGSVDSIFTYDNCTVNMSDGTISSYLSSSGASIVNISGGNVSWGYVMDSSILNFSDGNIDRRLYSYHSSTVNMSGGSVSEEICAHNNSTVNISGGNVSNKVSAYDTSILNLSGGSIANLIAWNSSTVIFEGYDFTLGQGLSWGLDGQTIFGTGILTGIWFDHTSFVIPITYHNTDATILAIPEPATLVLLSLAGLFLRKKNRR